MVVFNGFSVWGIRVRIDQSWFIAFLFFAWTLSAGYFPLQAPDYSAYTYWLFGTLSSLGLFGCVLLHELSPACRPERIRMFDLSSQSPTASRKSVPAVPPIRAMKIDSTSSLELRFDVGTQHLLAT